MHASRIVRGTKHNGRSRRVRAAAGVEVDRRDLAGRLDDDLYAVRADANLAAVLDHFGRTGEVEALHRTSSDFREPGEVAVKHAVKRAALGDLDDINVILGTVVGTGDVAVWLNFELTVSGRVDFRGVELLLDVHDPLLAGHKVVINNFVGGGGLKAAFDVGDLKLNTQAAGADVRPLAEIGRLDFFDVVAAGC